MTTVAEIGERGLIARIRERVPHAPSWVAVGIGDDAAVLEFERNEVEVVTTDSLVEGVHFDRKFVPPRAVGYRALAANLSDIASMGARPRAALLSLALPDSLAVEEFDAVVDGLLSLANSYQVSLVGGNIARSPGPLLVDITALGTVRKRRVMRRDGARPGDVLYVSGHVGSSAAGLEWCRENGLKAASQAGALSDADDADPLHAAARRFLYPDPRVRLGQLLSRNRAVTACIDLSDGLADGVHQLAAASGVGATVEANALPIAQGVRKWFERDGRDPVTASITGGEDYELLFTVPGRRRRLVEALDRGIGSIRLTRIGVITRGSSVVLRRGEPGTDESLPKGYTHFR